jgi:hypothetical protein
MAQWLWRAERHPEEAVALLAQAESLLHEHAGDTALQGMVRRMRRAFSWQPADGIVSSAGTHYLRQPLFAPESPGSRVRSALLEPLSEGQRFIFGNQRVGIVLHNPAAASRATLRFRLEEIGYIDARDMRVVYRLDDEPAGIVHLTPDRPSQRLRLAIPQGRHLLRLRILSALPNQVLRFGIRDDGRLIHAGRERVSERAYHVSTPDEPLELALEGPAWLRLDEAVDGETRSRYLFVQAGWHELRLPPASGREASYYRLFRQRREDQDRQGGLRERRLHLPEMAIAEEAPPLPPGGPAVRDLLSISGQEDGTWEYYGNLVSRRNLDEDRAADRSERFIELGAGHRLFQQHTDLYLASGILARLREHGGTTLGLMGDLYWKSGMRELNLDLGGDLFAQRPNSGIGTQWSLLLKAGLSQYRPLDGKTHHRPNFGLFQRWLSMDDSGRGPSEDVDQDIYTRYKDDHQRGLTLGDTLTHNPWRDMRLRSGLSLTTNETLNPFEPDHADFSLGADQLIGELELGARYRLRHYFDDDDRASDADRQDLKLRFEWRRWPTLQSGWHLGLEVDHELESGDTSVFLTLRHQRSGGRIYRDFRPGKVGFESLRTRHELERHFPLVEESR